MPMFMQIRIVVIVLVSRDKNGHRVHVLYDLLVVSVRGRTSEFLFCKQFHGILCRRYTA